MGDTATNANHGVPECPKSGSAMVKRTARRGANAGGRFWGCSTYPRCKGTRPDSDDVAYTTRQPADDMSDAPGSPTRGAAPNPATERGTDHATPAYTKETEVNVGHDRPCRRVDWYDATLRRSGWRAFYTTVGASLRSLPDRRFAGLANCWAAREERPALHNERGANPEDGRRLVTATMRKLLARGTTPPLHPDAELALLEALGFGEHLAEPDSPADVGPRLNRRPPLEDSSFSVPFFGEATFDVALTESPAESSFVEWAADRAPGSTRWLIPQPSLERLERSAADARSPARLSPSGDGSGDSRCDFLFAPPGMAQAVIEVDGSQHAEQQAVDRRRDHRLSRVGIRTVRVTTRELTSGQGPGLDEAGAILDSSPQASNEMEPLVWAPIQAHRLVLGLCEAIDGGFLGGERWIVEVHDAIGQAVDLAGHYLALFDALDRMWGGGNVAPAEAVLICEGQARVYRRNPHGIYQGTSIDDWLDSLPHPPDARIVLDSGRTPSEVMPDSDEVPTVVIRSTALGMPMRDSSRLPSSRVEPFVSCNLPDVQDSLEIVLRAIFAKERLLEGQLEGITEVLSGRDSAVLLPTGAGKSMIYQLAGLCLPGRTLVVDPLVALIDDQVGGLSKQGIDRAVGISRRTASLGGDAADAYFVFVTPERLQRQRFRDELTEASEVAPVNMAVIDEAHCVSEWGHDFRPAYLNLGRTLRSACRGALGVPALLALTGTASRAVLTDVLFQLEITNQQENSIVRPTTFDRPELSYRVVRTVPADSQARLRGELRALAGRFDAVAATFFEPTGHNRDTYSGIVFVPTVNGWHGLAETTEDVLEVIASAVPFSSSSNPPKGMQADWEKLSLHNSDIFKENQAAAIVTTNAFGMGIDKPNIRWIVHFGLPGSIEAFYQEVGRAGRDRRPAKSVLILTEHDAAENRRRLGPDGGTDTERQGRPRSERDDVDTALYFHKNSFPPKAKELEQLLEIFALLEKGDRRVPLGQKDGSRDAAKRALHRLAMLGVVTDYCLEGYGPSEVAEVRCSDQRPEDIVEGLLRFVERSQPGRLTAVQAEVEVQYATRLDAVEQCGEMLIDFVYDTIERSRRRSLQEMWLLAGDGASDGEIVRRRVLDFLTEGDVAPLVQELAESSEFTFADWTRNWGTIASDNDAREWRSASARLLESYPDHPGLLASRGLAEALLPAGDLQEFERHFAQSLAPGARDRYSVNESDMEAMILWLLSVIGGDEVDKSDSLRLALRRARPKPGALAGAIVGAAQRGGMAFRAVEDWLRQNWRTDPQLATLVLAETLESANELALRTVTRYRRDGNGRA